MKDCYGELSIKAIRSWNLEGWTSYEELEGRNPRKDWGLNCDLLSASEVVSWTRSILPAKLSNNCISSKSFGLRLL